MPELSTCVAVASPISVQSAVDRTDSVHDQGALRCLRHHCVMAALVGDWCSLGFVLPCISDDVDGMLENLKVL